MTILRPGAAAGEITVQIGTIQAVPGAVGALPVTLHTDGEAVSGFRNDLLFEAPIVTVGRDATHADCTQNPDLLSGDLGAQFTFPVGCADDTQCVRAAASLSSETFRAGSVMVYTCAVQVAGAAGPGNYAVRCSNAHTADLEGTLLSASCADGAVVVRRTGADDAQPAVAPDADADARRAWRTGARRRERERPT